MPRPEDIAWKFVVRLEGKKWRCPYCHKGSSGSVTRVKSHFLKQPKEGIASCSKVPEHIRTLMELLLNHELHNKDDIAWKFVNRVDGSKWRCYYCSGEFFGDLTGVKGHLLGVPNEGISICTGVQEHVRTLMRSLLDEVAEEESGEANGQSTAELSPLLTPISLEIARSLVPTPRGPTHIRNLNQQDFNGLNSDQQLQAERQFRHGLTMPSLVQNSHGESISSSTMALAEGESYLLDSPSYQPLCSIQSPYPEGMRMNDRQTPAEASSFQYDQLPAVGNSQHSQLQTSMDIDALIASQTSESHVIEATIVDTRVPEAATNTIGPSSSQVIEQGFSNREHAERQCTEVPDHMRTLMRLLLDEVAEEQSKESHGQSSMEPQSRHMPTQAEVAEEESKEANRQFSTEPESRDMLPPAVPRSSQSFEVMENLLQSATDMPNFTSDQERQFQETLGMPSLVRNRHGESSMMASTEEGPNPLSLLYQRQCSIPSQIQMNDQQTPTGASSFQYDQLPAGGNSNCLQDCNRHSQLQTPMDIDHSIASQHTIDSRVIEAIMVDSQVPEAATNTTGPSSSQDMNRGSPVMDVRSIYANDEEIRNLKRKVEELDDKEAVIKEQMEIESAASSVRKKPRILVDRWLKETERARNNFQIIGQANAKTLPPKEQVETLTREVEELIGKTLPQTLLIEERDAKGVKFWERKLTGEAIHRNIKLIWDRLTKNRAYKLGIYGMGGVGKTTIMMHIHNRLLKDATFDGVAFITVSQDCSIYKLQSDICKELKLGVMEDEHEKKRAAMLLELLERKKNCVLILDDVWERLDLEEVGIPVRANGCKLVLTTRSFDVCCQMHCQEKIKIKPLYGIEAESLFLEELGSEVPLNSETKAIMKSIVEECAGLPIGVIMMARSMRGVTDVFEWRDSLVKLEESSKGQTDMEKKVLMNLKFSYDRLGNPDVQQCFLSCALYPEDELIDKFELVEFFIDQGLIGGLNTRREQYDRGLTILNKLGNVCLLEDHGSKMKMHDLIRDMALHIMSATSIVKAGKRLESIPYEEYWTDALEKVSLMENYISEIPLNMSPNCPKLSTLLLNGNLSINLVLPDSFFKQLCGLKVLNLSQCGLTELPNSISDLVNLRALLLSGCEELCHIPYLGKLTSLRKLDVSGCYELEEVPKGLEMLVNLRYLNLCGSSIGELPERVLGGLLNLQHLKVDFLDGQDMTKLRALDTLECSFEDVDGFNKCVRFIEQSNPRCYYHLRMVENDIFYDKGSYSTKFGSWGRTVDIMQWDHSIVSVGGECTSIYILIPQDVQTMTMNYCDGITNLSGMGPLEYLQVLEIERCENLRVLCGGQDKEVIDIHDSPAPTPTPRLFPNLGILNIFSCPQLKYLFGHGFKSGLPHLGKIEIYGCEEMVGIIAAVTSPPQHPLPFFPSLKEISVDCCDKMKRAVESEWIPLFPNLRSITVSRCEKMEEIIGGPPPYLPVEEISLESLEVRYCHNMRKLFPHEWLLHLRNLQSIEVDHCKGMVEMISGVRQGQEGSIMTPVNNTPSSFQPPISLPKLEQLKLCNLPQLKSICKVPISCDSMKDLSVYKCPELKGIPLQLRLRDIEELPYIWVQDEEKWKTLMWDHPDALAILQPYLRKGEYAIELFA